MVGWLVGWLAGWLVGWLVLKAYSRISPKNQLFFYQEHIFEALHEWFLSVDMIFPH